MTCGSSRPATRPLAASSRPGRRHVFSSGCMPGRVGVCTVPPSRWAAMPPSHQAVPLGTLPRSQRCGSLGHQSVQTHTGAEAWDRAPRATLVRSSLDESVVRARVWSGGRAPGGDARDSARIGLGAGSLKRAVRRGHHMQLGPFVLPGARPGSARRLAGPARQPRRGRPRPRRDNAARARRAQVVSREQDVSDRRSAGARLAGGPLGVRKDGCSGEDAPEAGCCGSRLAGLLPSSRPAVLAAERAGCRARALGQDDELHTIPRERYEDAPPVRR